MPTDENLRKRGCVIVSICHFCRNSLESAQHIFLMCPVTHQLWDWLMKGTDIALDVSSIHNLILCTGSLNSQLARKVLSFAIVHTIWSIWIDRNSRYFSNKSSSMSTLFHNVLVEVKLSFDLKLTHSAAAMQDFKIARLFGLQLQARRFAPIQDVCWIPPPVGCIKFNYDGSSIGSPSCGSIGFVIRDSSSSFLGACCQNIGYATALEAEFGTCMLAIERASSMNLDQIWIETDSLAVVKTFNTNEGVPWRMRVRWHNCLTFCSLIHSNCSHILREGNLVVDALAKNGQSLAMYSSQWWDSAPDFVSTLMYRDSLGLPVTRLNMN
jgi:ribonuclease HI